jgi:nicotinamidase-related amidase
MNDKPVLLVIDAQQGFFDKSWGESNNPECESNILRLLNI